MKKILVLIVFFTLTVAHSKPLFALPEGAQVEVGTAAFETTDSLTLNINADDKTVINFNSFNISQNETVNFIQPTSASSVLSRVTGNQASSILGMLTANGLLILTNPNGINFGSTANVQVNSLIASNLDITTNNFINGNYIFEHNPNSAFAQILNEGIIEGNNIALVASSVKNTGIIQAKLGTVHLAAGDKATVTLDARGLIQVAINEAVSSKVYDANGVSVKNAVENSGTIEAAEVYMSAATAADIFENAINQTGIIKATGLIEENGIIRIVANKNIQTSGTLEAAAGNIEVTSNDALYVNAKLSTKGNTKLAADKDININADITTTSGNLELLADNDLDGTGSFKQAKATFISTVNFGDITISASGESTLANVNSAGALILKQAGAEVIFNQWPDSTITTRGSLQINSGVTLNAANTLFEIGKDWISWGNFNPQTSTVKLISSEMAQVLGSNVFYNFSITVPGKIVKFDAEKTQAILGNLTLRGDYGNLLVLRSIEPAKLWKINPQGTTDIVYTLISDSVNIRGPPLKAIHSDSQGNNLNWDLSIRWTGEGVDSNWSTSSNWDTGTVPTSKSSVLFDGITGLNANKDSTVDPQFLGIIESLSLNGYTSTITLARSLGAHYYTRTTGALNVGNFLLDPTISISGTAYQNDESTGVGASQNVALRVNGGDASTAATGADSTFTFSNISVNSGDTLTIYFYGASDTSAGTYTGNFVTITDGTNITGVTLYDDHVVVRSDSGTTAITIADLADYDNDNNSTNLLFTANTGSPNTFSVESSVELFIPSGEPFTPGGNTTINSGGLDLNGTWTETGTETITCTGAFDSTGGTFTAASGTVTFQDSGFTITGSQTLNNVTFANASGGDRTFTIASGTTLTVNGTLSISTNWAISLDTGDISAKGDITITNLAGTGGGSATITINGTGNQVLTGSGTAGGGSLPNVVINKASGNLTLSSVISTNRNWTHTSMGTGSLITTGSTMVFYQSSRTITGTHSLNNVTFANASGGDITFTIASGTTLTVNGTLTISTNWGISLNTGDISAKGDITITNLSENGGGSATITINGTGDQVLTGSGTAGGGRLPNVTINKSSGTLSLASIISTNGNWTYTAGTVDATTNNSTVAFYGSKNLDGQGTSATMAFDNVTFAGTTTLAGNLDVNGDLTINASSTLDTSVTNYSVNVAEDWANSGTFTSNSSVVTFDGSSNATITTGGTGTTQDFQTLTVSKTSSAYLQLTTNGLDVDGTLTIDSGATLDLNNLSITSATTISNSGTLKLTGDETLSVAPTNNAGSTVEYSATSGTRNIKDWSYVNLKINGSGGTFTLGATEDPSGTFTVSAGTFNSNGNTLTVTGLATVNGGTYQASTAKQTLNGGLTISSGTFTGSSGAVDVNGTLTLSGGTLTAPSGDFTLSGDFTVSNSPTFTAGSNTVSFDATSGTQTLTSSTKSFYNLTHSGAGTLQLVDNLTLSNGGTLTNSAGTFDTETNSKSVTVGSSGTSSTLTFSGGTWEGDGGTGANQNITVWGSATFSAGTFKKGANTLTVKSNLTNSGATFTGGSGAITVDNNFTLSSGTLTSTSGTLSVGGDWNDVGGTFTHNSGTIDFTKSSGTQTLTTLGSQTYYNLTHSGAGTLQLSIWQYRKQITLQNAYVDSDLTNFPVLIYLDPAVSGSGLGSSIQDSGQDLRFTSSDGITALKYEIESYSEASGNVTSYIWVKVPSITSASGATIYMYYGNSSASDGQDATNVWDSNYVGIWHLKETDIDGGSGDIKDSTSNANNGTTSGMDTSDQVTGQIDGSFDFDGTNDYVRVPTAVSVASLNAYTITGWFKSTGISSERMIYDEENTGNGNPLLLIKINNGDVAGVFRATQRGDIAGSSGVTATGDFGDNQWHYFAWVRYSASSLELFVDGVSKGTSSTNPGTTTINLVTIGGNNAGNKMYPGLLDEVRISNDDRSAAWVKFEYNNVTQSDNELTWASQATNGLTIAGTFTNSAGTFNANGLANTVTGLTTVSGGEYQASTATQTFNAGLTISSGTFTGSSGAVDVNGTLTLSGGTLTAPSGDFTLSGDFTVSNSPTFTAGSNTVSFDGTTNLTSNGITFNNIQIGTDTASGSLTLMDNTDINGTLSFNTTGGTAALVSTSRQVNYAGATLNLTNADTFTTTSSTWIFDATSGTQTLNSAGKSFNNLQHSQAGTLQLTSNALTAAGTFTNSAGTFDANGQATTVTGLATVSAGTYQASTATQTFNAGLTISGGTFTGSSGAVDVNGTLTLSSGTLTAPSGNLNVSGNWSNTGGTFTHNSGTVEFDGIDAATISGSNTFNNLKCETAGKTLNFTAGTTQTIADTLTLTGQTGNLITLRSTATPTQWNIDPQGAGALARSVSFVDVMDSNNINSLLINPNSSVNSGNNTNWFPAASTTTTSASLIEGESILYKRPLFLLQPMAVPAIIFVGPVIVALPVAVPAPMPTPVPTPAIITPPAEAPIPAPIPPAPLPPTPKPELFAGAYSFVNLPAIATSETFAGTSSITTLVKPPSFEGIISQPVLPPVIPIPSFEGVSPALVLPEPQPELFAGVYSFANLPVTTKSAPIMPSQPDFEHISASSILPKPGSPLIFESVTGEAKVKVMFPGGARVIPTYGVGVPLGAEKPLLEPSIKEEEEKE